MQIILMRRKTNNFSSEDNITHENPFDNAEKDIRLALAHITNKIWIKSVQVINTSQGSMLWAQQQQEKVIVICEPQDQTLENENLASLVAHAISLRANLQIEKIILTPTIQVKAVEQVGEETYKVKPYFAEFIARNEEYRKSLLNKNIKEIKFELVQINPNSYRPTGKISTEMHDGKVSFDPKNIYHVLANSFSENEALRHKILNEEVDEVLYRITKDNNVIFNVRSTTAFKLSLPKSEMKNTKDVTKVTNQLKDMDLTQSEQKPDDEHRAPSPTRH